MPQPRVPWPWSQMGGDLRWQKEDWNLPVDLVCIDTDAMRVMGRHSFPVEFLLSKYWPISAMVRGTRQEI